MKAALALLIGTVGQKVSFLKPHARQMAEGSLIVTATDLAKQL